MTHPNLLFIAFVNDIKLWEKLRRLHLLMFGVALHINSAEWARRADIFASSAAYAASSVDYRE